MRFVAAAVLLVIFVVSIGSLVMGADLLQATLPGGLPAGNAIVALGLISAAAIPVLLSALPTLRAIVARATLVAAVAWLPFSAALAGNLALNFSGRNGDVWFWSSAVLLALILGNIPWSVVASVLDARHRSGASRSRA